MKRYLIAFTALVTTAFATPTQATVDAYVLYNVPYRSVQTDDICFMRLPLLGSFGIPQASLAQASLLPTQIRRDYPVGYFNNNLAAPAKLMVHTYVSDSYTGTGVWEYSMKLDVRALATFNGTSLTGRRATIQSAKLALLAIARNMDDLSDGNYRLTVQFIGLPSQTSLPGTTLYATTRYPYTASSPLLIAYERELIDVEGSCPDAFE
jgi:hypothetical protein